MANITVTDIANEIFELLDSPSTISIASISSWVRSHVGNVNGLILTDLTIDESTLEFSSPSNIPLTWDIMAIFMKMYEVYYYNKLILTNLGASAWDSVIEITSDGSSVKKLNKNTVSLTYVQLKNGSSSELMVLVNGYKLNRSSPSQVAGADSLQCYNNLYNKYYNRFRTLPCG